MCIYYYSGTPDSRCTVGALKIILALFCKGKTSEKAQCKCKLTLDLKTTFHISIRIVITFTFTDIFSVLVQDGTVGLTGLQFFCESVQLVSKL